MSKNYPCLRITILTLFPEMFNGPFDYSIIKRAINRKLIKIDFINIRDFGLGKYKSIDDRPYGGGAGMIMRVDVIASVLASSKCNPSTSLGAGVQSAKFKEKIVLLDPRGKKFNQAMVRRFSKLDHLILICGHYEGVDERVKKLVDEVISIGDYILTGGEIPAMAITDSVTRLLPGVLAKSEATKNESFSIPKTKDQSLKTNLEYPQYTRPEIYDGTKVPSILLSGNHKKIDQWRKEQAEKIVSQFHLGQIDLKSR